MKATIKPEKREETVLREYRHLKLIIAEERGKVEYLTRRIIELEGKIKHKRAVIQGNQARLDELREEAVGIIGAMLDEGAD